MTGSGILGTENYGLLAAQARRPVYARALDEGHEKLLHGPAVKPVFRPYN